MLLDGDMARPEAERYGHLGIDAELRVLGSAGVQQANITCRSSRATRPSAVMQHLDTIKHPRRLFRFLECCWAVSSNSCYTCAARSHIAILFESWSLFRRVYSIVEIVLSFVAWRLGPLSRSLLRGMSEPRPISLKLSRPL